MKIKKLLFTIPLLVLLTGALAMAAEINCNTLVDDDSTDNTSAINTCTTAAQGEDEKIVNTNCVSSFC